MSISVRNTYFFTFYLENRGKKFRFSGIRLKVPKKLLLLRYLRYCVMAMYLKVLQR